MGGGFPVEALDVDAGQFGCVDIALKVIEVVFVAVAVPSVDMVGDVQKGLFGKLRGEQLGDRLLLPEGMELDELDGVNQGIVPEAFLRGMARGGFRELADRDLGLEGRSGRQRRRRLPRWRLGREGGASSRKESGLYPGQKVPRARAHRTRTRGTRHLARRRCGDRRAVNRGDRSRLDGRAFRGAL